MPFEPAEPRPRGDAHPEGAQDGHTGQRLRLAAAVAIAWLGLLAHNQLSLPVSVVSAENVGPLAVYVALAVWCARSRGAGAARAALAGWTLVNLVVGGIVTVLPLPFLPFVPEQTPGHYVAHAIYAVTQLPLLAFVVPATRLRRAA